MGRYDTNKFKVLSILSFGYNTTGHVYLLLGSRYRCNYERFDESETFRRSESNKFKVLSILSFGYKKSCKSQNSVFQREHKPYAVNVLMNFCTVG